VSWSGENEPVVFRLSAFIPRCFLRQEAAIRRFIHQAHQARTQSQEGTTTSQQKAETCLHSQIRDGSALFRARKWAHPHGYMHTPRWVRGHTKVGVRANRDGYMGAPRWVHAYNHMGSRAHRDGHIGLPRWLHGCAKMGMWAQQGGIVGTPRWVHGRTKVGLWAHQDGITHVPIYG
jgi:hypothetical protein